MSCKADLHTHSTASDGQYAPSELAELVKKRGVEAWALTDHDSVDGVEEAKAAGRALGLRVIQGADDYLNLHILGYGFSAPTMQSWLDSLKSGRNDRKYRIRDFLRTKGLEIPLDEVDAEAAGGSIGRPHFAMVMLKHGMVATRKEAFDRYLDTKEFRQRVKRLKADARTCVETIRAAGGRVSLAHPYQTGLEGQELEDLVRTLADYGLDAIECSYPKYTQQQQQFYCYLADKYQLHRTGGSDFHGESVKPEIKLMALELELDWLLKV